MADDAAPFTIRRCAALNAAGGAEAMDTFNTIDARVRSHIEQELRAAEQGRLVYRALYGAQGDRQLRARMVSCSTWMRRLAARIAGGRTDDPVEAIAH